MQVITDPKDMQARSEARRQAGNTIVLVPTMGFLHEGHLSLMRMGRRRGDDLVVSIFVNPAQFGPGEDLDSYPRDIERDLELVRNLGADAVFTPQAAALYGRDFQTFINLKKLSQHLCGISRPHFFGGVATVVAKLFNIVKPHIAVFGEKDFQQLLVIRQMVRDLNFDIEILGSPIVREPDGLAMSSRNAYLTHDQRPSALSLSKALDDARNSVEHGQTDAKKVIEAAVKRISSHPDTVIDYVAICDSETLEDLKTINKPALMALAVKVGTTRLIDNTILNP